MPKPAKIRKKKSFMFTTKHHSFIGIVGAIIAAITLGALVFLTYLCFMQRGKIDRNLGGVGLFACLSNIIGFFCGTSALNERDIHRWLPITDLIANGIIFLVWVIYIILGAHSFF